MFIGRNENDNCPDYNPIKRVRTVGYIKMWVGFDKSNEVKLICIHKMCVYYYISVGSNVPFQPK